MNEKGHCKHCGNQISGDNNSNEFCPQQCGIEYQVEYK